MIKMTPNPHSDNPKEQDHWEAKRPKAPEEAVETEENGVRKYIVPKSELPKGVSFQMKLGERKDKDKPDRTLNFMVRKTQMNNGEEFYK